MHGHIYKEIVSSHWQTGRLVLTLQYSHILSKVRLHWGSLLTIKRTYTYNAKIEWVVVSSYIWSQSMWYKPDVDKTIITSEYVQYFGERPFSTDPFERCTACSEQERYLHMYLYCQKSIRWAPSTSIGVLPTSRDISKRTSYARTVKAATAEDVTAFRSTKK